MVYCEINKKNGCHWEGTRKDYLEHYQKCKDNYVPCILGCGMNVNNQNDHLDICANNNGELPNNLDANQLIIWNQIKKSQKSVENIDQIINRKCDENKEHISVLTNTIADIFGKLMLATKRLDVCQKFINENQKFCVKYDSNSDLFENYRKNELIWEPANANVITLLKIELPNITADWIITLARDNIDYYNDYQKYTLFRNFDENKYYFDKNRRILNNLQRCAYSHDEILWPIYYRIVNYRNDYNGNSTVCTGNQYDRVNSSLVHIQEGDGKEKRTIRLIHCEFVHSEERPQNRLEQLRNLFYKHQTNTLTNDDIDMCSRYKYDLGNITLCAQRI